MVANIPEDMLGRSPEEALSLDPDEMKNSRLGNELIIKLHILMKSSQIYDQKNVALNQVVQGSLELINHFLKSERSLALKVIRNGLFINGKRLKVGVDSYIGFKFVLEQLQKKRVGEIRIFGVLSEKMLKDGLTKKEQERGFSSRPSGSSKAWSPELRRTNSSMPEK